ncbi:unnamed protein product [Dibothriocephalus latus]|uniref:Uncharacterized protein n=1 Tax=Dibothriocephalus latus TaxID=60516 RepID=A0A3P6VGE3_DIBLA|nr:unnamed protein product [Dibothriocephalus latus]
MQVTQEADELELQTLLPKMVAGISHLSLDSNLSGSPSTSQQASPTVAICACLREVLPSNLKQDIGDLIGSVPSPKYLKFRSEEHIQIHEEGLGGLRPSRGCFHRLLRWPFCGRTKAFSPEGPVAEARGAGVIPPLFVNWRISSKVYIFGTSCPMKVRRSILLLGPAGLRKSHVLKCLWEMAPDSFFSPSRKSGTFFITV